MIIVNGRRIDVPAGASVSIIGGEIFINGVAQTGERLSGVVRVEVIGNLTNFYTDASATVCGNVVGDLQAGGSVTCGDVGGSVNAGGSIDCGVVSGSANAGGSIRTGRSR